MTNEQNAPVPMPVAMLLARRLDEAARCNEAVMREAVKDVIAQLIDSTRTNVYGSPPAAGDAVAGVVLMPDEGVTLVRIGSEDEWVNTRGARRLFASPAAPPSVTDAAREVVYAYRQRFMGVTRLVGPIDEQVEQLEATLTHPGHKHAQEDAAQEGGEYLEDWTGGGGGYHRHGLGCPDLPPLTDAELAAFGHDEQMIADGWIPSPDYVPYGERCTCRRYLPIDSEAK